MSFGGTVKVVLFTAVGNRLVNPHPSGIGNSCRCSCVNKVERFRISEQNLESFSWMTVLAILFIDLSPKTNCFVILHKEGVG